MRPLEAPTGTLLAGLLAALLVGCGGGREAARGDGAAKVDAGPSSEAVRAYIEAGMLARAGRLIDAADRYDEAAALDPESAQVWLAAARARARLAQWDAAAERAEKAWRLDPGSPGVRDELGRIYVAAERPDEARALYTRHLDANPADAAAWAGYGAVLLALGDADAAAEALSRATELEPERADAWERLGHAHLRAGRHLPAARAYERAVRLDPGREHLDRLVLSLALEIGDIELARGAARRMAGPDAPPGAPSLAVAHLLVQRGDLLSAANELEWILERHPHLGRALLMMGQIQARVGRDAQALSFLERIRPGDPARADALRLMAALALRAGGGEQRDQTEQIDRAVALLREARAERPDDPAVVLDLARALRVAKRERDARALLEQALARWPRESELAYFLGLLLHGAGEHEAAMARMQAILEHDPDHAGALNFIGYTWAERGERLDEAESLIRRALRERPDDPAIIDSLGWVHFQKGRLEAAERALRRAVELAPDEAEIRYHLAEVLIAAGRVDEGLAELDAAIERATDPEEKRRYEGRRAAIRRGRR